MAPTRPHVATLVRPALAAVALGALAVAGCADQSVTPTEGRGAVLSLTGAVAAGGQYIIGLEPGASPDAAIAASGGRLVEAAPGFGFYAVAGVADPARLRVPGVRFVERDVSVSVDAQPLNAAVPDAPTATNQAALAAAAPAPLWVTNGLQWDLKAMSADVAIAAGARGAGINVCIIDSGLDGEHQELAGQVTQSASFVPNSLANRDSSGHGTHVGATVGAKGVVMSGVAPGAKLFGAKVFNATGSSSSILPFLAAVRWCADQGAHVANMSLGGTRVLAGQPASSNPDVQAYTEAMAYARALGMVVVVSAGNSNLRLPNPALVVVPAQIPGTIIVGSTAPTSRNVPALGSTGLIRTLPRAVPSEWDPRRAADVVLNADSRAYYSNFGTGVDVFAPGGRTAHSLTNPLRITTETVVDSVTRQPVVPARTARVQHGTVYDAVWSACSRWSGYTGSNVLANGLPGGGGQCRAAAQNTRYVGLQGTSMAAPHVAGLAALVYEAAGGVRSPEMRAKVEACIRSSTDNIGPATTFGGGRVNAVKAVACGKS